MLSKEFHCRDCGGGEGYRSRPRTAVEKYVLPLMWLRPVRCCGCFRRYWVPTFVHVRELSAPDSSRQAAA